jgi:hypothetical protein
VNTTHRVGVFLAPVAVFLVAGLYTIVSERRTRTNILLLAGLFTAPVAACLVAEPYAIQRQLVVLPFAALIATYGVEFALTVNTTPMRRAAWCLVALMAIQFSVFYLDYFTAYQARSAFAFNGNIRGGVDEIVQREPVGEARPVYLGQDVAFADLYWRFYVTKYGRQDLLDRPVRFDPRTIDLQSVPDRSLLLARTGAFVDRSETGAPRTVRVIENVDRTVCCEVFEKVGHE